MCSNFQQPDAIRFRLPGWLPGYIAGRGRFDDIEQRMALVIGASHRNILEGTGGPFAAAVFERDSGRLVSLGVNRVTSEGLSILHAEMVAVSLAQRKIGNYDLGAGGLPAHQLVSSTEPCAMCFGAVCWAGVHSLAVGAREADAREIGFDEGPKPGDWIGELEQRGIDVTRDILRQDAIAVLQKYRQLNGCRYNSRENGLN